MTIATLACYVFVTLKMTEWRIAFVRKMHASDNDSNSKAIDSLINYETVKYFGNEEHETKRYDVGLRNYAAAAVKGKQSLSMLNISQGAIIALGLVALMVMAAFDVGAGVMSLGDFVLVNTYLIQLYLPLNILGFAYREIKLSLASMEEMFDLLDEPEEVKDPENPQPFSARDASVAFEGVHFQYNEDREFLKGISFEVPAGKTCAIVGSSGSGKSTIARLLFRFYDVNAGAVKLDGVDIREMTQKDLRHAVGMVPQDTVLFNDTIYYNIAYGAPEASRDAVIKAAKLAKIHTFIESLPQGYDTPLGENATNLSGGQRQRLSIARAIVRNAPILLLDEATSALDNQSEALVQAALEELMKDRTTLVIAHRLSTISSADKIVVIESGRLVDQGKHDELVNKAGGVYATLHRGGLA